eukprot:scpid63337/ scgid16703/ 
MSEKEQEEADLVVTSSTLLTYKHNYAHRQCSYGKVVLTYLKCLLVLSLPGLNNVLVRYVCTVMYWYMYTYTQSSWTMGAGIHVHALSGMCMHQVTHTCTLPERTWEFGTTCT